MADSTEPHAASSNGQPSLKDRVKELQLTDRMESTRRGRSSSSTAWLPWVLCILMALSWAGVALRWYRGGGGGGARSGEGAAASKTSPTSQEKSFATGEVVLEAKGYLIPSQSIPISPIDVAGRVIRLEIEEGKTFKKGEVLAVIDSTRFVAESKEAAAQLAAAQARYEELKASWIYEKQQAEAELAESRAQLAKDELEYLTTQATLSGAVAKLELGLLKRKWDAAKERVRVLEIKNDLTRGTPREFRIEAALRDMEAAKARLAKSIWSLDNCTITAPVTGVILTKKAEYGSLINPVVGGVSTSLCEIADLGKIEVDLEIQERDIARIEKGMICRVRPDAWPNRVYDAYVDRMMPIANRARGIIPVRVRVVVPPEEEQGRYLKPEMGVAVTFIKEMVNPSVKLAAELGGEVGPMPRELKEDGPIPGGRPER